MAGFSKNPRHGKRPSSSSFSPCSSTFTMVLFVAFCLFGVWMLTSSSFIPSQATTITTRSSSSNPSLSTATKAGGGDQDAGSEEEDSRTEPSKEHLQREINNGEAEDNRQSDEDNTQQEKTGGNEETQYKNVGDAANAEVQQASDQHGDDNQLQLEQQQSDAQSNEEQQNDSGDKREDLETGENQQEMHDEQQPLVTESEEKPTVVEEQKQQIGVDNEESQQQTQQETQQQGESWSNNEQQETKKDQVENDWGNQQETQQKQDQNTQTSELENQQETQHQQIQTNDFENHQDTQLQQQQQEQQQESESDNDRNQQQRTQTEIEENHDRIEQLIEEKTSGSNQQSEEGTGEAQLQTQQQTDVDGNSEKQQQEQDDSSQTGEGSSGEEGQQQGEKFTGPNAGDSLPENSQLEVLNEGGGKKKAWKVQADESQNEKERRRDEELQSNRGSESGSNIGNLNGYEWELCNVTAGADYIPCLDNEKAIKQLHGFHHYEHRERHCPEEAPACLVPLPNGYKHSIEWPKSRSKIWYNNIPHTKLAEVKGHQNWVKVTGQYLLFPGGGTQFIHGALHYIDFLQQSVRDIAWGKHSRVILDVGCGVASFGGYLFERDVVTLSFAPKDEHEAQVQFALERGIPAISAVMGTQRLQFPSSVFDLIHCARCRVPWHADGGTLLLELNRLLRPGGYFVWSATPVYQKLKEDVEIWNAMKSLTASMCWDLVTIKKDRLNGVGAAFFRKPTSNECYENRKHHSPPLCKEDDDPNAAWYIPLKACMHRVPVDSSLRGSQWPEEWPIRLRVPPYWINSSQVGVYGKPAPDDFTSDYEHWKRVVTKSYLTGLGIDWSRVRNVMDMRAVYGGFAAALKDLKVWVMNVVNIDSPDTLPIIYERGLFGIYHDWCESFSTYPRTYDLLHADCLFSQLKKRCKIVPVMAEVDRIVRPGGKLIVRDESGVVSEVENLLKSLHWEVRLTFSKNQEGILFAEKSDWRPEKISNFS